MALISRVTRLFRADIHAVLDRVEEPDILLRQAIREMEEDLAHDEQRHRRLDCEREQLIKREAEYRHQHSSLGDELDICLAADEEGLARSLIRRRLEAEHALQLLGRRRETLATQIERLARRRHDNQARYESMRQQAELFDEQQGNSDGLESWPGLDIRVRDEDVEIALLKERQRRAAR